MSGWKYFAAGAFLAVAVGPPAARAVTIVSMVGDRDGFNGTYNPNAVTFPYRFQYLGNVPDNTGSDPIEMDRDYFEESQSPMWTHTFAVPAGFVITSAQFEIVTFDNDSQATGSPASTNGEIYLDGFDFHRGNDQDFFFDAVGETFGGADRTYSDGAAELFIADIPQSLWPLLLDGNVVITYTGATPENVGVDYMQITINGFVPEPSSIVLLGAGAVALWAGLRWRRARGQAWAIAKRRFQNPAPLRASGERVG